MGHTLKLIVLLSLTILSCADSSHKATSSVEGLHGDTTFQLDEKNQNTTSVAKNSSNKDTLIVDRKSAIFIEPDSIQIENLKKQVAENEFYTGADDYMFYMNTAHEFLDSVKLTSLKTKDKMFIKFIRSDKTQQIIRLDKLDELWSIYFFEPQKKAKQIDMTMIDEEYKSYFK